MSPIGRIKSETIKQGGKFMDKMLSIFFLLSNQFNELCNLFKKYQLKVLPIATKLVEEFLYGFFSTTNFVV